MRFVFLALLIANIVAGYTWHVFSHRQARDAEDPADPHAARLVLALERNQSSAGQSVGDGPFADTAVGGAPAEQDVLAREPTEPVEHGDASPGAQDVTDAATGPRIGFGLPDDEPIRDPGGSIVLQAAPGPADVEPSPLIGDDGAPRAERPVSEQAGESIGMGKVPAAESPDLSVGCFSIGPFPGRQPLVELASRLTGQGIEAVVVEVEGPGRQSYWVHVTPRESDEEASAVVAELERRGIESFVIRDPGPLQNGVSLGVFRERAGAEKLAQRHADLGMPVAIGSVVTAASTRYLIRARGPAPQDPARRAWLQSVLAELRLDAAIEEC